MLIKFKVSNFLSFYNEQEFSMIAGAPKKKEEHLIDKDNLKLLKFSAIYGANASGKSNLLKAVILAKLIIMKGIYTNLNNLYCRIKSSNAQEKSSFEFEIKLKDKFYAYGFDILLSENSIKGEWLYEIDAKKNKDVLIYTRELNRDIVINEEYFNNNSEIIDRLKLYSSDMKNQDNILFLTIMNKNKENLYEEYIDNEIVILKELFTWFKESLVVISPQALLDNSPYFLSEENIEKINEIIGAFGTGIKKCRYESSSMDEIVGKIRPEVLKDIQNRLEMAYLKNIKEKLNKKVIQGVLRIDKEMYILKKSSDSKIEVFKVVLEHKNNESAYSFSEESDGTQRLFDLIEVLLNKNKEKVYFLDEIDRCLHPQLTYKFIKTFLNNSNNENTQLIVTTHESRLLDFGLVRRDEIWFANRNKYGPTELYSLEEFNERFDKKIDKAYLEGRYGGVPIFDTIFPVGDENI